ncbi:hypothetical protein, partial [Yersinia pestis]
SRLPPGSDFRRWVWITIAPFVTPTNSSVYSVAQGNYRNASALNNSRYKKVESERQIVWNPFEPHLCCPQGKPQG